jgi:hypothetical protein
MLRSQGEANYIRKDQHWHSAEDPSRIIVVNWTSNIEISFSYKHGNPPPGEAPTRVVTRGVFRRTFIKGIPKIRPAAVATQLERIGVSPPLLPAQVVRSSWPMPQTPETRLEAGNVWLARNSIKCTILGVETSQVVYSTEVAPSYRWNLSLKIFLETYTWLRGPLNITPETPIPPANTPVTLAPPIPVASSFHQGDKWRTKTDKYSATILSVDNINVTYHLPRNNKLYTMLISGFLSHFEKDPGEVNPELEALKAENAKLKELLKMSYAMMTTRPKGFGDHVKEMKEFLGIVPVVPVAPMPQVASPPPTTKTLSSDWMMPAMPLEKKQSSNPNKYQEAVGAMMGRPPITDDDEVPF